MTRRELGRLAAAIFTAPAGRNRLETEIVRLQLRHTWTVATSTSDYRDNLYVRFTALGVTGIGEGRRWPAIGKTPARDRRRSNRWASFWRLPIRGSSPGSWRRSFSAFRATTPPNARWTWR